MPTLSKFAPPALVLTALVAPAVSWPSSFSAELPAVSKRGQSFGSMGITNYESAADAICAWTHNVPNTGFIAGNSYKLWIGNKANNAAATVGMVYQVGAGSKENTGSTSASKVAFKEIDWTAPDDASVELKAICGAGGTYDKMWIADPVTLNKDSRAMCDNQVSCDAGTFLDTSKKCAGSTCNAITDKGACCSTQAKCSSVATNPADFCGTDKVIDSNKANDFCAVAACNKNTGTDVTACCKSSPTTTPSSVTPSSVTPSSVTPSSVTPSSVTPSSVTPSSVTPSSATSSSVTPSSVTPSSATTSSATPSSATPSSATSSSATPSSATPSLATPSSAMNSGSISDSGSGAMSMSMVGASALAMAVLMLVI